MSFYLNFLELCNNVGKSPSRVAVEIGTSKPAVTRWKAGSIPSDAVMVKLADYFGVSVEYLRGETDQKEKPPIVEDERLKELYELTAGLSDTDIIALKSFVAGLKANH